MSHQRYLISLCLILNCAFASFGQKQLLMQDATYEPTIKTVLMYPRGNSVQSVLDPAVIGMNSPTKLVLSFDDIKDDAEYFYVYFVHCNSDWTKSDLRPNMYLNRFNGIEIENFEFSSEAKINYVHYEFELPKFKYSGNYLAVVYRDRDQKDIVLSKRFRVYENQVGVGGRISRSASVSNRLSHQRIEVTVNYNGLKSIDPRKEFNVAVRQNERSDRVKFLDKTFLNEADQLIRLQNLGDENDFLGGNEFRSFDLSTINFSGRNVAEVSFEDNRPIANLRMVQEANPVYLQQLDVNGKFYNRDLEGISSAITAEYIRVKFNLDYPEINDKIYVLGAFNGWKKNEASMMKYDLETGKYFNSVLLKQGWYDYTYEIEGNLAGIDRSFFETENLYEIFVYFRPMGSRGDRLVGYSRINYNSRR